ncbi:hypothetical protein [Nocardia yamanashiensis]|uniref:hypothetical protein n=1 Tax=Nocardia yamanashiensis TaxID=209247 RepID=UPI00082FBBF8|nr:hypothetical protein [Nocardia yamanashiensis]
MTLTDIRVLAYELADRISAVTDEEWKPARHRDQPDHATLTNTEGIHLTLTPDTTEASRYHLIGSVRHIDPTLAAYATETGHHLYTAELDSRSSIEDLAYTARCEVITPVRNALALCRAAKTAADHADRTRRDLLEAMSEAIDCQVAIRDDESRYVRTWTDREVRVLIDTDQTVCGPFGDVHGFHIHLSGPAEFGPEATQFAHGFLIDYQAFTRRHRPEPTTP